MFISWCEPAQSDGRATSQVPHWGCRIHWDRELTGAVAKVVGDSSSHSSGVNGLKQTVTPLLTSHSSSAVVVAVVTGTVVGEVEVGTVVAVVTGTVVGEVEVGTVVAVVTGTVVGEVEVGTVVAVVTGTVVGLSSKSHSVRSLTV